MQPRQLPAINKKGMTDTATMKHAAAQVVQEQLGHLLPLPEGGVTRHHSLHNTLREAILVTEQKLRTYKLSAVKKKCTNSLP
jgi:hypothetical protein